MLIFFPIGIKDATVSRIPWVCILIAVATLGAFVHVAYIGNNTAAEQAKHEELLVYWQEHPYVEPADALKERWLRDVVPLIGAARERAQTPVDFLLEDEQRTFDRMAAEFHRLRGKSLTEQWSLVPAKGFAQKGLLGYLFVHAGWLHLIGNLFFLYLVGPFLEDNWGRLFFLVFYLLGGAVAGAAQAALDMSSSVPIIGASGAVAACMGAFALRFATRGVRVFYWFLFVFVGTFTVPAWLWTGFWLAREVAYFKLLGTGAQIAFMAHIGGFVFGAVFALALKLANFEKLFIQPGLDAKQGGVVRQNAHVERGMTALHAGQRDLAQAAFRRALSEEPSSHDAAMGLARLSADAGDAVGATRALAGVLNNAVAKNDDGTIKNAIDELGSSFDPTALRAATAFRVAQHLEQNQPDVAVSCYRAAAAAEGTLTGKALLQAVELLMERLNDPEEAHAVAQQAQAIDLSLDQQQQLEVLVARMEQGRDLEVADLGGAGAASDMPLPGRADPSADLAASAAIPAINSSSGGGLELDLSTSSTVSPIPSAVSDPTSLDLDVASDVVAGLELAGAAPSVSMPDALETDLSLSSSPPLQPAMPTAAPPAAPQPTPTPASQAAAPAPSTTARSPGRPSLAKPAAPVRRTSCEVVPMGKPVVEMSKFVGRFDNGFSVQMEQGARVNLSFDLVSSIAFGVVNEVPGRTRRLLVLDLVLPPRQGTLRVLRFYSDTMGLDALFPAGMPPLEALRTLVDGLAERFKVRPPADADEASRGEYPRFATLQEYDSAYYG